MRPELRRVAVCALGLVAAATFPAAALGETARSVIGTAGEARFMDSGLVYADGSRVHLAPFMTLP